MSINQSIFKAYDIRGVYPQELNERTAFLVGRSFVKFLKKKNPKIVVGRDNRSSSPSLFKSLVKGIQEEGGTVINIGLSTSPMFYFAVWRYKFDAGMEITASHNPPQYNGFKMVRDGAIPISGNTGIMEIEKIAIELDKIQSQDKPKIRFAKKIITKNVLPDYIKINLKRIDFKKMKPLKIVIDTANAVPGVLLSQVFKKLSFKVYHLFAKLDSNFPNHNPNPSEKENLKSLQQAIIKKRADLGVAFDGDGDRIIFADEKGKIISPDLITALMAEIILKENPGEKILYEVCSSRAVEETINKNGGIPILSRVGHSFIKETSKKENVIFGGEISGHYSYREHFFCEAPLFVLFKVLQELSKEENNKLSELISPFKKYFHSGIIPFSVSEKNKKQILEKIENKYKTGKILKLDGLRIDFKEWWFNLRPSNTEPIIKLVIEAENPSLLKEKEKELRNLIKSH